MNCLEAVKTRSESEIDVRTTKNEECGRSKALGGKRRSVSQAQESRAQCM